MRGSPARKSRARRKTGPPAEGPVPLLVAVRCMPPPVVQVAWQENPTGRDAPLAVVSEGERVLAACPRALAAGVRAGQRLVQARLCCPTLIWAAPNAVAAMVLYEDLLAALGALSPLIEAADPTGGIVYLDGSGLSRLVGDPPAIGRAAQTAAAAVGVTVQCGAASTRLLARVVGERGTTGDAPAYHSDETTRRLLHALPLADPLFALADPILAQFADLGIRMAGALAAVPRAALTLRFAPDVTALWEVLNGAPEPPLRPWSAPAVLQAGYTEEEGLADRLVEEAILRNLANVLLGHLRQNGQAAAQLTLRLVLSDRTRRVVRSRHWPPLGASGPLVRAALALRDRAHERLAATPIQTLRLEAGELAPDQGGQAPLFGDPVTARRERLTALFADQADRHGSALLGRWRPDPLSPDGWTRECGPP
jgi:nucleotidyltransferase/DNA polymerase involved in DNA repair